MIDAGLPIVQCLDILAGQTNNPIFADILRDVKEAVEQGSTFSDALRRALVACGADASRFSGISARKGGLTTAITAGVTEEILFLLSGHGQSRAARHYMHLQDPARLFDAYRAFGL